MHHPHHSLPVYEEESGNHSRLCQYTSRPPERTPKVKSIDFMCCVHDVRLRKMSSRARQKVLTVVCPVFLAS